MKRLKSLAYTNPENAVVEKNEISYKKKENGRGNFFWINP